MTARPRPISGQAPRTPGSRPTAPRLWVVQAGADAVTGFSVSGGTLTKVSQAAGPAGATPTGIVVT